MLLGKVWATEIVRAGLDDPETAVKSLSLDLAARIGPQFFGKELETLTGDYDQEIRSAAIILTTQLTSSRKN